MFGKSIKGAKITRILYGSDFHGSEAVFRKFLAAGIQYRADILIVGGDVTGKAMVPIIHLGGGRYVGYVFGRKEEASTPEELARVKRIVNNVGFYPIAIEKDEANELEKNPDLMAKRFAAEMCQRIREWMRLAEEKLVPQHIQLFFMPGNDDLNLIDEVIAEFQDVRNPDMKHFIIGDEYELVGNSNSNMTPWACPRDIEEDELEKKLAELEHLIQDPGHTIAVLHVPPFQSGLDTCPELDGNLKIITHGGQVLMKSAGSTAVKAFIERVSPMLALHGHIHESPGHVRIGRTLAINAGSEYAEGILKAAIINLQDGGVKGHLLVSG
ncbi:MAG: metallophosphoesterase [Spirochaetota bacterium]